MPLLMPTALMSTGLLPMGALIDVLSSIVMVLFTLSALLLTIVILLQEGKGGGLAGAFGGAGADAFGVKAGSVNKFTAWLGAAFLGLALLHAGMQQAYSSKSIMGTDSNVEDAVERYDEEAGPGPGAIGDEDTDTDGGDENPEDE